MAPASIDLVLAGQSMIRADLREESPGAIRDIRDLVGSRAACVFTNFEAAVFDPARGQGQADGRFASPTGAVATLAESGFNTLALANNHAFDLGQPGILATLETAEAAGMTCAGTGHDAASAASARFLSTPDGVIGFVAVASGLVLDGRAGPQHAGVNELRVSDATPDDADAARILDVVRGAAEISDHLIVSHHNHHYPGVREPADFKQFLLSQLPARLGPPQWFETWCRSLVDAGADVVAGHGPPFLHGIEIYRGRPIFYSLGNFIFQVPPESIHLEEPIMWESVVARVSFSGGGLGRVDLTPIGMNKVGRGLPNPHDQFDVNEYHRTRGLPRRVGGAQARHLLGRLAERSAAYGTQLDVGEQSARVILDTDSSDAQGATMVRRK